MATLGRRTVQSAVKFTGVGLHTGTMARLTIYPRHTLEGQACIEFRENKPSPVTLTACHGNVSSTTLSTVLSTPCGSSSIATVEHLMAAVAGALVTDAVIEFEGPEVPILDGSSIEFSEGLKEARVVAYPPNAQPQHLIHIKRRVKVNDGNRWISIEPLAETDASSCLKVHLDSDYSSKAGARMKYSSDFSLYWNQLSGDFEANIAPARTFAFEDDIPTMRDMGLIKGGSLENAVIFRSDGCVVNEEGLRFDDECGRHKVLDCIGDLRLGGLLSGRVCGHMTGHSLHISLLRAVFADERNYDEECDGDF